jgi:hypothetical protein
MLLYNIITSFVCNSLLIHNNYRPYYNYKNKNFIKLFSRNYITINNDIDSNNNESLNNISNDTSNILNNTSNESLNNILDNQTLSYNIFINFAKTNNITNTKYNNNKFYEGCDMRYYNISTNEDEYIIEKIKENFYKKNILDNLLDYRISEQYKIKYIEEYNSIFNDNKYKYNIKSGGLLNDWNFTL